MANDDWEDDETIGYKRPPRYTRFEKGQSGNPAGRPRKKRQAPSPPVLSDLDRLQRAEFDRLVNVTENGKSTQISMLHAVTRSQANQAGKGNVIAQRDFLKNARELELREARAQEHQAEIAREQAAEEARVKAVLFEHFANLKLRRK